MYPTGFPHPSRHMLPRSFTLQTWANIGCPPLYTNMSTPSPICKLGHLVNTHCAYIYSSSLAISTSLTVQT